jgi:hypothetical protein
LPQLRGVAGVEVKALSDSDSSEFPEQGPVAA